MQIYNSSEDANFFLISFPKSGRTWLRVILGKIFCLYFNLPCNKLIFLDQLSCICPKIPKIIISHDDDPQWKKPDELSTDKSFYSDKK